MKVCSVAIASLFGFASCLNLRNSTSHVVTEGAPSFEAYYATHTGRGIWKWNVALDAYQRHFNQFAAKEGKMLEIGVQSGGSINMYHQVLPNMYYYGMDINTNCQAFNDPKTTIYLGDQASVPGWTHFFSAITPALDICIDDGGHQAHQMLATIQQVLPHMNAGGFFLTEDIHGVNDDYLSKFFHPAADAIAQTGPKVESVHLYPFVLGVQMVQGVWQPPAAAATYSDFASLMKALPQHLGAVAKLENPAWTDLHAPDALRNFFNSFYNIYEGVVREEPEHCHNGMADLCAMIATNTPQQNLVKGVHIYKTYALVEVHAQPPAIRADRKGNEWIPYSGPA